MYVGELLREQILCRGKYTLTLSSFYLFDHRAFTDFTPLHSNSSIGTVNSCRDTRSSINPPEQLYRLAQINR